MRERWFRVLFRRRVSVGLLLLLQFAFLIRLITDGGKMFHTINLLLRVTSVLVVLTIIAKKDKGSYKTLWVFLILLFPLFGGLMYVLFTFQSPTRQMREALQRVEQKAAPLFRLSGVSYEEAKKQTGSYFPQVRYLQDYVGFPVYSHTSTQYLSPGEAMLEALLAELEQAEQYIFLEFFIIQEGVMWNSVLEVLKRKAAQGVKVRLIYDDIGCLFLLPVNYAQTLEKLGIECAAFNPFRPFLTAKQNNRDHRKIAVIDGKAAITGGINLADEYINLVKKLGHWKDAAVLVKGEAAWSFALMFLQMWEVCKKTGEEFADYYPWKDKPCEVESDGFVQPYADSPMDQENVGEHVYLQILNQAQNYVYICTPYLIIDDSLVSALTLTAKRGVDVRIVTPHRGDRKLVHMTTRSYYRELIKAGVKIYEYSNGFLHAKTFVSDDHVATVGTTNLDFRSLYLHFECGTWLWDSRAVMEVKQDFLKTLEICQQITEADCSHPFPIRLLQDILRLFAPLM